MATNRPRTLRESVAIATDAAPAADSFGSEAAPGNEESAQVTRAGVLVRVSPEIRRALKIAAIERGTTVQAMLLQAIEVVLRGDVETPAPDMRTGL